MLLGKKERLKKEFLANVSGVNKEEIYSHLRKINNEQDIYTYFVKLYSFNRVTLDNEDVNDFVLRVYSDWYFLNRNKYNKNLNVVKFFSNSFYLPTKLSYDTDALNLVRSHKFDDILPISIQYIDKEKDKYFLVIRSDELFGFDTNKCDFKVRLYINMKASTVLDFAKLFLDRIYLSEIPLILKVLNNDDRSDTITIYTDYNYARSIVDIIEDLKREEPKVFKYMHEVSPLLGKVNEYIGFGEVEEFKQTYLYSRSDALSKIGIQAVVENLKDLFVKNEEKMIVTSNGRTLTPTQYLRYLIEKSAIELIDERISNLNILRKAEIDILEKIKADINSYINFDKEVEKFKKSLTRNTNYSLEIPYIGVSDFDFVSKLFKMFSVENDSYLPFPSSVKKDLISQVFFKIKENDEIDLKQFLQSYFREKLVYILRDILYNEINNLTSHKETSMLVKVRKKMIEKLKQVLGLIEEDDDEGKDYLNRFIYDFVRMLSYGSCEDIATSIGGKEVVIDGENVVFELLEIIPDLKNRMEYLINNKDFIDNILYGFGINATNMCLNRSTENVIIKERDCVEIREIEDNVK